MYTKEQKLETIAKLFSSIQELDAMMQDDPQLNDIISQYDIFSKSADEVAYEASEALTHARRELK